MNGLPGWDDLSDLGKGAALLAEPLSYCWQSPAGWEDSVPGKPFCNRRRGHDGNHVSHVVWSSDTDLSADSAVLDKIIGAYPDGRPAKAGGGAS